MRILPPSAGLEILGIEQEPGAARDQPGPSIPVARGYPDPAPARHRRYRATPRHLRRSLGARHPMRRWPGRGPRGRTRAVRSIPSPPRIPAQANKRSSTGPSLARLFVVTTTILAAHNFRNGAAMKALKRDCSQIPGSAADVLQNVNSRGHPGFRPGQTPQRARRRSYSGDRECSAGPITKLGIDCMTNHSLKPPSGRVGSYRK